MAALACALLCACGNGTAEDHGGRTSANVESKQPASAAMKPAEQASPPAPAAQAPTEASPPTAARSGQIPGVAESEPSGAAATSEPRPRAVPEEHVSRFPRPEEIQLAPMGQEITPSALTSSPGYVPPNDPEADAVRTGKRVVGKIDLPFTGGESTPERLAIRILAAVEASDMNALQALRVNADEFTQILWPEFPQSRPITNAKVGDVWFFLDQRCHGGISAGLTDWGGQKLELLGLTYEVGRAPYTNFTLYDGVRLHVRAESGEEFALKFVGTLAERNGVWKVYAYTDRSD